jgi:hypothetical protein
MIEHTTKITPENLPVGHKWDSHGGCFKAVKAPESPEGWYWQACNGAALWEGYVGQYLYDYNPRWICTNQLKEPAP